MKVIFLDIDGVLNGYNRWTTLLYKIIDALNSEKLRLWYKKEITPFGVHERKVKRLSKIIKATNAKIVISSSWRIILNNTPYDKLTKNYKRLIDLFIKYDIDIFDITPSSVDGKRDKEIITWLSRHEKDVENFIILDDENTFLEAFHSDEKFIQTSSVKYGEMIHGYDKEDTGLKNKHVKQAIKILNRKGE
jgi:hypothetical protein